MAEMKPLECPACNSHNLLLKYEAAYVYSYVIDDNAPGLQNEQEFLSFLYDNREQTSSRQYLQCGACRAEYPCFFNDWDGTASIRALQEAMKAGKE